MDLLTSSTLFGTNDEFSIAFTIAGLDVRWYGIISVIGYFVAILIFLFVIWKRYKVNVDVAFYYIFIAIPMILLGARLWSVIIGDASINEFFNFRTGGLAIQGGVVFGVITALIYFPIMLHFPKYHSRVEINNQVYIQKPSLWIYADAIIPTILIGQAIGRWGNFFNGEIFGNPTSPESLAWLKLMMPGVYDHMCSTVQIGSNPVGTYFQPLFLYESFLNVIVFIIIYGLLAEIKSIRIGVISALYFISYGIIRFIMEPLRYNSYSFTGTYVINGILLTVGVLLLIYCQFIAIKIRNYKLFIFLKDYINIKFNKKNHNKIFLKDINNKKYIRVGSEQINFSGR